MQQKILILTAIPHGLRLDKEIREIESAIRRSARRDRFEIRIITAVRQQDIRRAIAEERPQIVHFCGHGLENGSLMLEDDGGQNKLVSPQGLAQLFQLHTSYVNCILLNTCHSAKLAEAIGQYINYTIGMNQEIKDKAAIAFAQGFYDALGYEAPNDLDVFQRAFDEALVATMLEDLPQGEIPVFLKREPQGKTTSTINQEINDADLATLRELLQLSGRAASERRRSLCIEIGIDPGDLSAIFTLPENDFAVELIYDLQRRGLETVICKLCNKLQLDFKGGKYSIKLAVIAAKLNC